MLFSHREKKKNTKQPGPLSLQKSTGYNFALPSGKHQEYQHHHREASESRDLALQAPQGEPRGKVHHPGRLEVFFLARPNISTFKGRVFSKIYEVEVEV